MKTKHTPGPWGVSKHAVPEYAFQAGIYQENDATRDLAIVKSGEADAHLIATAPDLLAALQAIVSNPDMADGEEPRRLIAEARAAIAKALGE